VITGFSLTNLNADVVLTGTNGQMATAYLLMATNIIEPMTQWKTVATGMLGDNSFTFIGTNAATAGSPQQFFRLSSTNYNP
ncbi:MAG: hypothetical protein ACRED1_12185, partial [Limisphaerales bacterium]